MRRRNAVFSTLTMIMLTMMTAGVAASAASVSAYADENRGTMQQQLACTPDVFRLCGSEIPDADRIVVCLRQNMPQLSDGCRAVFDANASMPNDTPQPPRAPAATPKNRENRVAQPMPLSPPAR
jgi:hypothetical protein